MDIKTVYYKKTNKTGLNLQNFHEGDIGIDVIAVGDPKIVGEEITTHSFMNRDKVFKRIKYIEYPTNIYLEPEESQFVFALSRSSICDTNLVLSNSIGLIDTGYRGQIGMRFKYIWGIDDLVISPTGEQGIKINMGAIYQKNDRIGQLVFMDKQCPVRFIEKDFLNETTRGEGGFGSTGK